MQLRGMRAALNTRREYSDGLENELYVICLRDAATLPEASAATRAAVWDCPFNELSLALFAFTGGVYYTAMGKMRATDELGELEALENKVNVHESGLKITRPRSVHDVLQPRKED